MNRKFYRLGELAALIGGTVEGDPNIEIQAVAPLDTAQNGDISFLANKRYLNKLNSTKASAVILEPGMDGAGRAVIRHDNPYLAMALTVDLFYPESPLIDEGVDLTAVIEPDTIIDPTTGIGPHCHIRNGSRIGKNTQLVSTVYIGNGVTIGSGCIFFPGVRILNGCKIGNNVILHSGTVVGSDGFGYVPSPTGLKKIKQVGWVEIGDDVEVGANSTIDRGALGPTRIGRGTKIDDQVHIAHNVQIGENCIIVAQVGISGSTRLGNGVVLGGQVGLVGHIELGDGAQVGAQSGVAKSVPSGTIVLGSPAREIGQAKRIEASLSRLPDLLKRIRKLEDNS